MNNIDLPPLPPTDRIAPEICSVVKRYLAIIADLPEEQRHQLFYHLQHCPDCSREWQVLNIVTKAVARIPSSRPSLHVEQAVLAAFSAEGQQAPVRRHKGQRSRGGLFVTLAACLSAVAVAALVLVLHMQQDFQLPANLSWNTYVLYHSQTMVDSDGRHYHIQTYDNLATNQMYVKTDAGDQLQIETISDAKQTLGMDVMHHIAQWDAGIWSSDDSLFNLDQLRADLQSGKALYLGKGTFQGQEVYRIRTAQGDILLLDSNYMPVNVLEAHQQADEPVYERIAWLSPGQIPSSTWEMDVPPGYMLGHLPPHPAMQ
jgi:hypothetical protein